MAVTAVEFHTGIADPVGYACRLLRKAYRLGARVRVTASDEGLSELDRALWTFEDREFVPHVRVAGCADTMLARTPIWLGGSASPTGRVAAPRLLVNIGAQAPADFDALDRLIEIVAGHPDDVEAGRKRWRAYRTAGLEVVHHGSGAAAE
jgi:DNA polymerase-3 subunit chi